MLTAWLPQQVRTYKDLVITSDFANVESNVTAIKVTITVAVIREEEGNYDNKRHNNGRRNS